MAILCCLPSLADVGIELDKSKKEHYSITHKQKWTVVKGKPHSEWKDSFLLCKYYASMKQFPVKQNHLKEIYRAISVTDIWLETKEVRWMRTQAWGI